MMKIKPQLMLLTASVIWGGGFVAGKLALDTLTPFAILAWRFGIAAALCGMIFHRRLRGTPRRTMLSGVAIGTLQMTALSLQLTGLQYTTSARQSFLCTAYVVLTPFLSRVLLKRRLTLRAVTAGFISLAGIGCICLSGSLSFNIGDALSLGFALLFGIQVVLTGRFLADDTDSLQLSFFQFLSAGGLALAIVLLRGDTLAPFSGTSLKGILYLSVLNTLVAFLLQNTAQKTLPEITAALIISL